MPASEVEGDTWTIPGERYKTGKTHIVPLSPAAMACLPLPEGSPRARKHCLQKHMKGIEPTLHGFRSSFRDWLAMSPRRRTTSPRCASGTSSARR
jgi:integrase